MRFINRQPSKGPKYNHQLRKKFSSTVKQPKTLSVSQLKAIFFNRQPWKVPTPHPHWISPGIACPLARTAHCFYVFGALFGPDEFSRLQFNKQILSPNILLLVQ